MCIILKQPEHGYTTRACLNMAIDNSGKKKKKSRLHKPKRKKRRLLILEEALSSKPVLHCERVLFLYTESAFSKRAGWVFSMTFVSLNKPCLSNQCNLRNELSFLKESSPSTGLVIWIKASSGAKPIS